VSRNAVDNHDALLDEWKYEVMTGWLETMMVESNEDRQNDKRIQLKMSQNLFTPTPPRYCDLEELLSSSCGPSWEVSFGNNFLVVLSGLVVREPLLA
jgi:hypothetical protein